MKRGPSSDPVQYTLRNIPTCVDRALRRRAARLDKSLDEVALEALARGAGIEHDGLERHDVDFLFGSWIEDAAFDQAVAEQRAIDPGLWRTHRPKGVTAA